jgi:hypothetical protein
MKKIYHFGSGAIILALSMFVWGCARMNATTNHNSSSGNLAASSLPPAIEPQHSDNPEDKMPRVKVQDAMKEVEEGKAVIIDVRGTDAYNMAHIKGSIDFPLSKIDGKDFKGLPKDKRIIAYCT